MKTLAEALSIIKSKAVHVATEMVDLFASCGRVLAEDIVADMSLPPANLSAMDGFACKIDDCDKPLTVIETIAAGAVPVKQIESGTCSRIMTGAMVPQGADTVVMFEHTEESDGRVHIKQLPRNRNIRYKAEDACSGDIVLCKGSLIRPAMIATLATFGIKSVPVTKQPSVAILATGSELVEPECMPAQGQIRNSNSYQLYAQTLRTGALPGYFGIVKDSQEATIAAIEKASGKADVLLVSGGVSQGDFDYVPDALKACGFDILISSLAIKPGKPTLFAVKGTKVVFGMPGNPVATYVIFELLVKPLLLQMMGHEYCPLRMTLPLDIEIKKKKGDRTEIVPVRITGESRVAKVAYHGSAHINAYTSAHGFIALEPDVTVLPAGTMVTLQLITPEGELC